MSYHTNNNFKNSSGNNSTTSNINHYKSISTNIYIDNNEKGNNNSYSKIYNK